MTEKLRSPSPASERSRGDGTPVQDMARGRERAPSPACGERVGVRGLGSSRPRPLTRSAEPVLGLAGGKTRGPSRPLPALRERGFAPRSPHRRGALGAAALTPRGPALAAEAETESHGLSTFGELKYPADFKHFDYVNPKAPKGGTLSLQIKRGAGNQNFDTFNTLNIFVLQGRRRRRHGRHLRQPDGRLRRRARTRSTASSPGRCAGRPTSSPTASCCAPRRASTTARG